jgi:hypothetical protein
MADTLTCVDYQALIDIGWRRSGKYCYIPTNSKWVVSATLHVNQLSRAVAGHAAPI